jgi:hypothetical protein
VIRELLAAPRDPPRDTKVAEYARRRAALRTATTKRRETAT